MSDDYSIVRYEEVKTHEQANREAQLTSASSTDYGSAPSNRRYGLCILRNPALAHTAVRQDQLPVCCRYQGLARPVPRLDSPKGRPPPPQRGLARTGQP